MIQTIKALEKRLRMLTKKYPLLVGWSRILIRGLVKKIDYNTEMTEIENKISIIILKTQATEIENKMPDITNLVLKASVNTKTT